MKKHFTCAAALMLLFMQLPILAQKSGDELFKATCAACHTINKGRLVGPDLAGVYDKRDRDWLMRFIRSSQQMIRDGDTAAVRLHEAYNRIPMPDNKLTDQELSDILAYIKDSDTQDSLSQVQVIPADTAHAEYSVQSVTLGRDLFRGSSKFMNGASPCMVCHHIQDQLVLGGGKLSLDLTNAYTKLGEAGIGAILGNPPFPVMKEALLDHPLSGDEIQAVTAFLKSVDRQSAYIPRQDSGGFGFLIMSSVCGLMILVHLYLLYDNRKIS